MHERTTSAVLIRVGRMVGQLLEEIHLGNLDAGGRTRLREAITRALAAVRSVVAGERFRELDVFAPATDPRRPFSESELRIHHAQLVGWISGVAGTADADGPHILETP
jgi:Protein of unknown function (DUF2587)